MIATQCPHCGKVFQAVETKDLSPQRSDAPKQNGVRRSGLSLSVRERQIVLLIQKAKSNKEIAFELGLTVGTVKEYLHHVFTKVGVRNRTELALSCGREYYQERQLTVQPVFNADPSNYSALLHQ